MSTAKITTIGLENYLSIEGKSLFDDLLIPEGIDKDTLTGSILMRAGEFEVLYSDPYFMRDMVSLWSRKHYRTFDKWVKALAISYDPLNNYDRTEEYTDTHKGDYKKNNTGTASGDSKRTDDLKHMILQQVMMLQLQMMFLPMIRQQAMILRINRSLIRTERTRELSQMMEP